MSSEAALGPTPGGELAELAARVDQLEVVGRQTAQTLADCVMHLAKGLDALQDQVTMIREAAGLAPARRDS